MLDIIGHPIGHKSFVVCKKNAYLRSVNLNSCTMAPFRLLPCGISDFKQLRRENLYFVDKTKYLPVMEDTDNFLFLVRPRRFGKSMFLSMLRSYYDINERDNFQQLFEGLWIADHPTKERGKFQILYLDFSQVGGTSEVLEKNFEEYCQIVIKEFAHKYARFYEEGFEESVAGFDSSRAMLSYINAKAKSMEHDLYLIIDEYDNFTNTVLNEEGEAVYHALTHANGFYRDIFKLFKGMFARILMMGVSPVTMDDVTSGFNIASNISLRPEFNMMLGFSEEDVRTMIRYYQSVGMLDGKDEEALIEEMKPWYNNYCFSRKSVDTDPKMFNCDMVLYYLNRVMQTGKSPSPMIDPNTRTDYAKMRKLIQIDALDNYRRNIIHEVTEKGFIIAELKESFDASRLIDRENFISLLFYYGMLTIGGIRGARLRLIIPNNNVRLQYYDWLLREYDRIAHVDVSQLQEVFDRAALDGEWRPMMEHLGKTYEDSSSVRQLMEGERNLQGFMTAMLSLNPYYFAAPEMELNHGYCDFFLMPDLNRYPMVRHSYILELKYLKADATEAEVERQWAEAVEQIRGYSEGPRVRQLIRDTQLHLIVMQVKGFEMLKAEEI